jgi:long-subunit fatty acid transport protein
VRRLLIAFLFVFAPRAVLADINALLAETPRTMALAGAYTALSEDASALYYNPAGLALVEGSYIGVSFVLSHPFFDASRAGQDVEILTPADQSYAIHLAWSPSTLLDGDLGFGFSLLLPHRRALAFNVHRFEEPYVVLYENSVELLQVRAGIAYEAFDMLSFGASMLLIAGLNGVVQIEAPFQTPEEVDPNKRTVVALTAVLPNKEFFTFGAQFRPSPTLTFGLSYRMPTYVPIELPIDFQIQILGLAPIRTVATLDVDVKYSPAQLTGGVAYRLGPDLLASFDLTFALYADYRIPYGNVTLDQRYNPDIVLLSPRVPKMSLRNVWIPRLGVEWYADDEVTLRAGYYFFRSFIRESDAPILDGDKHSLSFGASYALGKLFLPDESSLEFTAAGQLVYWASRSTADLDHSGLVLATTFGAEFRY